LSNKEAQSGFEHSLAPRLRRSSGENPHQEDRMQCHEIMKRDVQCVGKNTAAFEAAQLMRDKNVGFLPVCDQNKQVLGTITDRDITIRLVAEQRSPTEAVSTFMTNEAICCNSSDDIGVAEQRMSSEQKSRIMCVDENGRLEGVISLSDIVQVASNQRAADTMRGVTKREAA
jgi:CBS-domain-containing membrane protein